MPSYLSVDNFRLSASHSAISLDTSTREKTIKEKILDSKYRNLNLNLLTMAPSIDVATNVAGQGVEALKLAATSTTSLQREPLQLKGVLDQYESFDVTTVIGKEFPTVSLKEWLQAPNSDELLRDLAITSEFFFTVKGRYPKLIASLM